MMKVVGEEGPRVGMNPPKPVATLPVPKRLRGILCLDDFEVEARRHLPRPVFEYVAGGVEDNRARDSNREAFHDWAFVPRVLVGVKHRKTDATLFGHTYSAPFGVAPIGIAALYAFRGDLVLARAAREANLPMLMSGSSLIRLEDVLAESPGAWFQAYLPGDPKQMMALLERVKRAGFETLVITVDVPTSANRENNMRAGFSTPLRPTLRLAWEGITHPRWLFGSFLRTIARHGMPHFENNYAIRGAPILSSSVLRDYSDRGNLSWEDLARIRESWKDRRFIVKGILHAGDAKRACELGVDGIIVFQSRRKTARRLDRTASCPAGNRRRLRRRAGDVRQRRAPRHRRHQGARPRGKVRIPGPILRLCGGDGRRRGRAPCLPHTSVRDRPRHGDARHQRAR
jgi:L-lactate dehydrogenase (cytochrome)